MAAADAHRNVVLAASASYERFSLGRVARVEAAQLGAEVGEVLGLWHPTPKTAFCRKRQRPGNHLDYRAS